MTTPFVAIVNGQLRVIVYVSIHNVSTSFYYYDEMQYTSITIYNKAYCKLYKYKNVNTIKKVPHTTKKAKQALADDLAASFGRRIKQCYYRGKIGSDPEIFLGTPSNMPGLPAELLPAFDVLPSIKAPLITKTSVESFQNSIYWDGYQAEFNVYAGTCLSWGVDSVQNALTSMLTHVKNKHPNAKYLAKTTMDIPLERLMNDAEEHVAFGCNPSFNVYGMEGIKNNGREVAFRSAGGHIHFGVLGMDIKNTVKALDMILGVASVALLGKYDDPRRRTMYGLAGEYRTPKHGLEYRTLSNAWMFHPLAMHIIFDLARIAFALAREQDIIAKWNATEAETIACINNNDIKLAVTLLERNKDMFKQILAASTKYNTAGLVDRVYDAFINGIDSIINNFTDIENNWDINGAWIKHSNGKNLSVATFSILAGKKIS